MTILDHESITYHRDLLHIFNHGRDTFPKAEGKAVDVGGNARKWFRKRGRWGRRGARSGTGLPELGPTSSAGNTSYEEKAFTMLTPAHS